MAKHPFQHDAVRDTQWVGKGVAAPWLVVLAIVIAAGGLVLLLR
ncbi:hypothetical protein [Phenylobacterium sp.]